MEPAVIALIGTIFGGAGIKIVEWVLNRRGDQEDLATTIRAELRSEITQLRTRLDVQETEWRTRLSVQEAESAEWRIKYYGLMEQFIQVKSELNYAQRGTDWSKFPDKIDTPDQD